MHKRTPLQLLAYIPHLLLFLLSFLFRSRGPICQMYRFPIKAQYLYCHHAGDICVCLHARNPGTRTDCRKGCVHECARECARASVWVHFFAHYFQDRKYARSSWRQKSHKEDMNEVRRIIPVTHTHHIPSAHVATGLLVPGSGHILMITVEERLWELAFFQHRITQHDRT